MPCQDHQGRGNCGKYIGGHSKHKEENSIKCFVASNIRGFEWKTVVTK